MRQLHPSYEGFVKKQIPKYGKTFLEWYSENKTIDEVDALKFFQKTNKVCSEKIDFAPFSYYVEEPVTYHKDSFPKKLQLCHNLIASELIQGSNTNYGLDVVADIMDLYEDIIYEVSKRDNVYVSYFPSGYLNGRVYQADWVEFDTYNDLLEEFSSGISIVYLFRINENKKIQMRYYKREPLTRCVLVERLVAVNE